MKIIIIIIIIIILFPLGTPLLPNDKNVPGSTSYFVVQFFSSGEYYSMVCLYCVFIPLSLLSPVLSLGQKHLLSADHKRRGTSP